MPQPNWQPFEPATFDETKRADRPVLLVITKSWCPHSKRLLETTLAAPEVIARLDQSFTVMHVDAERRPDVNERYGSGSWPTLAFLTAGGELISHQGFLEADALLESVDRAQRVAHDHADEIHARLRSLWQQDELDGANGQAVGGLNREITEDVANAIYEKFDHRYGGWGEGSKFPHPEAIDFALVRVAKGTDSRMEQVVTLTLDRMLDGAIHDSIDGGFFRYSKTPDWRTPDLEKVLDANAMRLRCYLEAYQIFGTKSYRRCAEGIVDWMLGFMLDGDTGGFFSSLDADAEYYLHDRAGRDQRGRPHVDRTIYANYNAMAVSSLLKASLVLDLPELRGVAMRTVSFLLEKLFDDREGVFHYWDGTYHLPGMLSDQGYVIRALVDASQHTGDTEYLLPAERIAEIAVEHQKAAGGGFYDILRDSRQPGSMQRRNRSILENSVMAESLLRLSYLTRRPEFHDEAVSTLESFANGYRQYGYYVAGYGRAVDLIFYEPLTITVVGAHDDPATIALREAALGGYVPSRIVQSLDPAKDPILLERSGIRFEDRATAHIALGRETQAVAHSPEELLQQVEDLETQRR